VRIVQCVGGWRSVSHVRIRVVTAAVSPVGSTMESVTRPGCRQVVTEKLWAS
jgi:hypothetical protein